MANLKTLLASLLNSFLNTGNFKQAVVDASTIDLNSVQRINAQTAIAPFSGYVSVQVDTVRSDDNDQSAYFIYSKSNSASHVCLFGLRCVTTIQQTAHYFAPCEKGETVMYDGSGSNVYIEFYRLKGQSS